ncbi:MAG: serine/threonine protein kinase [Planctomycetes bacterium]|nr:serine/threonine protein kinase [Planctomycetota bacterium]
MRLIRNISRGGFGVVDEVELADGSRLARKTFQPVTNLPVGTNVDKLRKRFLREVKIQSQLPPELFVPVVGSDLTGDHPWYLMPMATNNLQAQIATDRQNNTVCKDALAAILNSLEYLHRLNIVHRDLKPANVLFVDGRWVVSDLGLVLPPGGETSTLTSMNSAWGTQQYAAPEQATGFHNVTAAADIFSFGCILHDMLGNAGRVPFSQCSCTGPVGQIIWKCTESRPTRRFRDIAALRGALLMVLATENASAPLPTVADLVTKLANVGAWDEEECAKFARAISTRESNLAFYRVFVAVDEDVLTALQVRCADTWVAVAEAYCDWVYSTNTFDFSYCDVVIGRLERIFSLGDMSVKAYAALAAARMAASHNRWYVMRRVLDLCGPQLDEGVAARLAIEVVASDAQDYFRLSASQIGREVSEFHPTLARLLAPTTPV